MGADQGEVGATPSTARHAVAEYKQVTVLFADVVNSMDLAAAVGVERYREIMTDLVDGASAIVARYGGTVDKFTGDGIMALFGAPVSLEDHAFRGCLAALGIQDAAAQLAVAVKDRDGVDLALRVGLNSGEVIAGDIGSGALGYTAVGTSVGMAQRMESVAPPGAVMLSESTARLVEHTAMLDEPELVSIKGAAQPVPARRLLGVAAHREPTAAARSTLVGREPETHTLAAMLGRATSGRGCVINVVGPAGIGKTRLVAEAVALAKRDGVEVFSTHCESHTADIALTVVARLLGDIAGISGLDAPAARARAHTQLPDADPEDLLLLDDLLGIADPAAVLPSIDPDARRRRLTALINTALLARTSAALFILEDAHWIDEVSESMLADFITVIPQTPSLVVNTYRPEYRGVLAQLPTAQTLALAPLTDTETATLVDELLGPDPSVRALNEVITTRAAGNPFFAEEIVRDLAEQGAIVGTRGSYYLHGDVAEVRVPATLQATIAARIDRLAVGAKRTLSAAAVIGSRFSPDLVRALDIDPALDELVKAELIDQIRFGPQTEYAFHHPLIRTVAYQSQLNADRTELHRRVAAVIETNEPESTEANAALIAEHLHAAGEVHAAYGWHMRAGAWSHMRNTLAARISWERAAQIADSLPADDAGRPAMRISPRTLLCVIGFRAGAPISGAPFDELRELCMAAGDKASLAIAMAALAIERMWFGHVGEASALASECFELAESACDDALRVGLSFLLNVPKQQSGQWAELLRWSQTAIDLADGDPVKGNFAIGSPLAMALASRGLARLALGRPGWRDDFNNAVQTARATDEMSHGVVMLYTYGSAIPGGGLVPDDTVMGEIDEAVQTAQRLSDDFALGLSLETQGLALVHRPSPTDRERGVQVLEQVRDMALQGRLTLTERPLVEVFMARERARRGDLDGAIPIMRTALDDLSSAGQFLGWGTVATGVFVETLVARGTDNDTREAEAATERLATAAGRVLFHDINVLRLRALLARAHGDEATYQELVRQYRATARSGDYEGHIAWAEAM